MRHALSEDQGIPKEVYIHARYWGRDQESTRGGCALGQARALLCLRAVPVARHHALEVFARALLVPLVRPRAPLSHRLAVPVGPEPVGVAVLIPQDGIGA